MLSDTECTRARVEEKRGKYILEDENTEKHRVGELQREKECAIRFRPVQSLYPIVLGRSSPRFRITVNRPPRTRSHTRK